MHTPQTQPPQTQTPHANKAALQAGPEALQTAAQPVNKAQPNAKKPKNKNKQGMEDLDAEQQALENLSEEWDAQAGDLPFEQSQNNQWPHHLQLAQANNGVVSDAGGASASTATTATTAGAAPAAATGFSLGTMGMVLGGLGLAAAAGGSSGSPASTPSSTPEQDTAPPTLEITFGGAPTAGEAVTLTFAFNEGVTGFDADDIQVTGGVKGAFTAVNASIYTLVITPNANGTTLEVSVAPGVATDLAGNSYAEGLVRETTLLAPPVAPPLVDTTPPTATLKAEPLTNNGNAVVKSSEVGTAYLVKNTHAVASLADIAGADDNVWNSVAIGTADTDTNLSVSGLLQGVYKLYTADATGNLSAVASDTVVVSNTSTTAMSLNAGMPDTDYGNLIAPVYVDKNWYFAWDLNGDGVHSSNQDTAGKFSANGSVVNAGGSGYQRDYMSHDVLDGLFRYDSAGNQETAVNAVGAVGDTDNTFRFASLNGVQLALPTIGNGETTTPTAGFTAGTEIDNSPSGEVNPTYNDLLAIWDAFNGSGTGTNLDGRPPGWGSAFFLWSATPTPSYDDLHVFLGTNNGLVHLYGVPEFGYAALQVL